MTASPASLAELNACVARDLSYLTLPANRWLPDVEKAGEVLLDAAVIGGGMAGLTVTAALGHMGLRVTAFDERPQGFEGPWATTARMETLRSPKTLTGPALGIPSLTFRAWFEAQFGAEDWARLDKIPRLQWMDYLRWYREVLGLDIRNGHRVSDIRPMGDHVELQIEGPDGTQVRRARRVVVATGRDGLGGPSLPPLVDGLPRHLWAHSSDRNDYAALAGKRVAVIGAGASAMDSAGTALEAGAARVDLLIRRADIPRVNRGMAMGNPGSVYGMRDLSDDWKWRIQTSLAEAQVPPPRASVLRVSRHANAQFHLGCALVSARAEGEEVVLETSKGPYRVDFVIFATGFKVDWAARPFLARIARDARTWGERIEPQNARDHASLLGLPDLGPAFEFLPRAGAPDAGISRVHCFCYPAVMSQGNISGDIPAISDGARRLARGIAGALWREDIDHHYQRMMTHNIPEVFGDEWTPAPHPQGVLA
ncbi:MAG: NAD(P)/FAD-dependent oxidoreductase [Rhodobacterales bacterium]|nr:NAD(P)/FAD-dependent oxidoreductase [Rhodobacterales bacterium]MDX5500181.1 NAD(P)/FAD-dependent oxidoreductase [Rhodobacterales bacterium]